MSTQTLTADGTPITPAWTPTGTGSIVTAVSDASDSTYVMRTTPGGYSPIVFSIGYYAIPAGQRLVQFRAKIRCKRPTLNALLFLEIGRLTYSSGGFGGPPGWTFTPLASSTILSQSVGAIEDKYGPWLAPTNDEYGAYDQDALALMGIRLSDSTGATMADRYLVHRVQLEAEFTTVPTITPLTAPATTVSDVAQPSAAWTYADSESDAQAAAQVRVYTAAQVAAGGFTPADTATYPPVSDTGIVLTTDPTLGIESPLPPTGNYSAYVRAAQLLRAGDPNSLAWTAWEPRAFTMAVDPPPTPTCTATWDSAQNRVGLAVAGFVNTLSLDSSGAEGGTVGGWAALTNGAAPVVSAAQADKGSNSIRLQATAAGTFTYTAPAGPCLPAQVVSAGAKLRAATTGRTTRAGVRFKDAGGTVLGAIIYGAAVADTTSGWAAPKVENATAPAGAASYELVIEVQSAAAGEQHYLDTAAAHPGATYVWSPGGTTGHVLTIERSTDGGATYSTLTALPMTGEVDQALTVYDYTAPRGLVGASVRYRAHSTAIASGGGFLLSLTSAASTVATSQDGLWWIKALANPALNIAGARIITGPTLATDEDTGVFRTLDGHTLIASGSVHGEDGSYTIATSTTAEWAALKAIARHQGQLLIQDPFGEQKTIRLIGQRNWTLLGTPAQPRRDLTVNYVEVD